jgi:hypothetical protein
MLSSSHPFRHLLRPKVGGIAFVLESMGEQFHSLLDVTIFYPQGPVNMWGFLSGKLPAIEVEIHEIPIPEQLLGGSYLNDLVYREKMQTWIQQLWEQKDRRLSELKAAQAAKS